MNLLKRTAAALVATVGLVALPAAAHAGTIIQYSTDGTNWTTICFDGSTCSGSASALGGQLTITIAGITSNSPGTPASSDIFTSTTQIDYTGTGVADIILRYASDGFTEPTQGLLESSISGTGTINTASTNTAAFTSCAVNVNIGTGPPPASDVACPGGITAPTLSPAVNVASFSATSTTLVAAIGTPYMLAQNLDVHIAGGSTLNFAGSTDLVAAPEPASIVLMGTGFLGLVGFVRRRKSQI